MRIGKILLSLFLLFSVEIVLSQNISYSNLSQTVTANPNSEVVVKVMASCTGNSTVPVSINPTFCVFDSGLTSLTFSNGTYLLPGEKSELTFKFKKTITKDETFTYKFSTNSSCFQAESEMIKITVNFKGGPLPPACNYPPPANFTMVSSTSNSIILKWDNVKGASSYFVVVYQEGNVNALKGLNANCCGIQVEGLNPNTKYSFSVKARCNETTFGQSVYVGGTTQPLPVEPANPPILDGTSNFCATASSGTVERYAIFYAPPNLTSITWTVDPSYAVSIRPNTGNDLLVSRASGVPFTVKAVIRVSGKNDVVLTKNVSNSCQVSALKKTDNINSPSNLIVSSACSSSGGVCGTANFQWTSASNAVLHEVEYMILNYAAGTPEPIRGSFQTINSFYTADNMYVNNNLKPWRINFRARSKSENGTWSDFSPWSANFAW
jgi:hypothetical protein